MPWFLAAAAMFPLGLLLLVVGLMVPSLALVYLSILCNIIWIPLLIVGVVRLLRSRSAR